MRSGGLTPPPPQSILSGRQLKNASYPEWLRDRPCEATATARDRGKWCEVLPRFSRAGADKRRPKFHPSEPKPLLIRVRRGFSFTRPRLGISRSRGPGGPRFSGPVFGAPSEALK